MYITLCVDPARTTQHATVSEVIREHEHDHDKRARRRRDPTCTRLAVNLRRQPARLLKSAMLRHDNTRATLERPARPASDNPRACPAAQSSKEEVGCLAAFSNPF